MINGVLVGQNSHLRNGMYLDLNWISASESLKGLIMFCHVSYCGILLCIYNQTHSGRTQFFRIPF